ncbi:MAG: tetratricopeptide repeat protein [Nitrosomonadales bacterium]|nr:tetratricopeptide repeat protein [Nitrosomonadales bacterium]
MESNTSFNIEHLKERLNNDAGDIEAAKFLGNIYYDKGDAAQAIVYYRHVLDLDPALPGVLTDLGTMYWRNENLSLAEQIFRDVIARHPGFAQAYVNLGLLLRHAKGSVAEARSIWQQLIDSNPGHELAAKARELLRETETMIN